MRFVLVFVVRLVFLASTASTHGCKSHRLPKNAAKAAGVIDEPGCGLSMASPMSSLGGFAVTKPVELAGSFMMGDGQTGAVSSEPT